MKKVFKIFLIVISVPILLLISALIYYQFDEPLTKNVKQVLDYKPLAIPPSKNAYYYLLGLFAGKTETPYIKAEEIIRVAKHNYLKNPSYNIFSGDEYPGSVVIRPSKKSEKLCEVSKPDCLVYIKQHTAVVKNIVNANEILIERLRDAYLLNAYQETPYVFGYGNGMLKIHNIALVDIAIKWFSGNKKTAITLLTKDLRFWRMVLASDAHLITRVIADAMVYRDMELFSETISDCAQCMNLDNDVKPFLMPFSKKELSLHQALGYDFRYMNSTMNYYNDKRNQKSSHSKIVYILFYKRHATMNQLYAMYDDIVKLSECPIRKLDRCYSKEKLIDSKGLNYASLEYLKNPIGSILVDIGRPALKNYSWYTHRLEIYRRLVLLKYKILNAHMRNNVQKYLNGLPSAIKSPIEGVPIKWMRKKQAIGIDFKYGINDLVMVKF